ncbi:DoxX family protein [Piscinibacter sp. XHJ-5]|uniref:DoxX family protein n=1 Tax=Piscinibacter sp. XHJ-5 TaxID=3037797 RepID=UPI002452A645|nr:DoxX family protein [Piscinibacter sp. XHJ-5]
MTMLARLWAWGECAIEALNRVQPAAQVLARWTVAEAFFRSGLTKLNDWGTTLALFADEYHVPLLPPEVAAVLGTTGELVLPVLLLLGFGGRFAAAGLFIVNAVAVASLNDIAPAALQQHVFWGSLLAGLVLWGPGRWSVDRVVAPWLRQRLMGEGEASSRYTAAA